MLADNNLGLIFERIVPAKKPRFNDIFVIQTIQDIHTIGSNSYIAPLYLYNGNNSIDKEKRKANLNQEIVREIEKKLFWIKICSRPRTFRSKKIRQFFSFGFARLYLLEEKCFAFLATAKNKEFLKIDFPRVPYPEDKKNFLQMGKIFYDLASLSEQKGVLGKSFLKIFLVKKIKFSKPPQYQLTRRVII